MIYLKKNVLPVYQIYEYLFTVLNILCLSFIQFNSTKYLFFPLQQIQRLDTNLFSMLYQIFKVEKHVG